MKKLAYIISRVFDPAILTAILIMIAVLNSSLSSLTKIIWVIVFEIIILITPVIYFYHLLLNHKISDIDITNRQERLPIFRFAATLWLLCFLLAVYFNLPTEVVITTACGLAVVGTWTIITRYWKISAHIGGATVFVMMLYYLFNLNIILWIGAPFIIFIGYCRYILKKHTLKQLVGALILSSILVIGIVGIFKL